MLLELDSGLDSLGFKKIIIRYLIYAEVSCVSTFYMKTSTSAVLCTEEITST